MRAAPATASPAAPRDVPWRLVAGHGAPWLLAGIALIAAGAWWIAAADSSIADALRHDRGAATRPLGLLVLPGVACVGIWLRAAWALKYLLATGRCAPVSVRFIEPPIALWRWRPRVGFWFADAQQRQHFAVRTCDRAVPPLFDGAGHELSVIYDASDPRRCHLVHGATFASQLR